MLWLMMKTMNILAVGIGTPGKYETGNIAL